MTAEGLKAIADALRSLMVVGLLFTILVFAFVYRQEIGAKIADLTEVSYGGTKLSFTVRLDLLTRSARSGVSASDQEMKAVLDRADKYKSDLHGMRILWVNNHPQEDRPLRDLLEDYGVRSDVARDTDSALARLEETRYDAVVSDEYRGGKAEGEALAKRITEPDLPVIIYGTNRQPKPPQGVQLLTNRPDEALGKIIDIAVVQASRLRATRTR